MKKRVNLQLKLNFSHIISDSNGITQGQNQINDLEKNLS